MSNKYNNKNLEGIILQSIKNNFIGCIFKCNEICLNIPDEFANKWENVKNFRINTNIFFKNENLGKLIIDIETNVKHTLKESLKNILKDIKVQEISFYKYNKIYTIKGNNYIILNN